MEHSGIVIIVAILIVGAVLVLLLTPSTQTTTQTTTLESFTSADRTENCEIICNQLRSTENPKFKMSCIDASRDGIKEDCEPTIKYEANQRTCKCASPLIKYDKFKCEDAYPMEKVNLLSVDCISGCLGEGGANQCRCNYGRGECSKNFSAHPTKYPKCAENAAGKIECSWVAK